MIETRQATPEEARAYNAFKEAVESPRHRDQVARAISYGEVCAMSQSWINDLVAAGGPRYPLPLWQESDQVEINRIIRRANQLETYVYSLETGKLFFRMSEKYPGDIDIGAEPGEEAPEVYEGLGIAFVVPLIWLAVVALITGAITAVASLDYFAKQDELDYKKRILDVDAWALKQDKATQDQWQTFKKTAATTPAQKGIFAGLGEALEKLGGIAIPIIIGLVLLSMMKSDKSEPATQNPRRARRRRLTKAQKRALLHRAAQRTLAQLQARTNPISCLGGGARTGGAAPYGGYTGRGTGRGRVHWSRDPVKRARQAGYIEAWIAGKQAGALGEFFRDKYGASEVQIDYSPAAGGRYEY